MNKPTEKHIELYVRYPSELSQKEKVWIEEWINKDQELQLLVEWFKKYYSEFDKVSSTKSKPKSIPSVIQLSPFENKSKFSNGFILAAQTSEAGKKRSALKTMKTFVSKEHKTLIRILHDDNDRQTKFYVISEFVDEDDIVLLDVAEEKSFFVSRPGGTFVISDVAMPEENILDWATCRLHLPLAKISVYKDPESGNINMDSSGVDRERYEIDYVTEEDKLQITTDFGDDPQPDKLVVSSAENSIFRSIDKGRCSIPSSDFKNTHSVLFFYN